MAVKTAKRTANQPPGKPFKKGQSGNPNGRPKKGETFTDLFLARISKAQLAEKLAEHIQKDNFSALQYGLDRVEGKPVQEIKVQSDVSIDAPIHLHVGGKLEVVEDDEHSGSSSDDQ